MVIAQGGISCVYLLQVGSMSREWQTEEIRWELCINNYLCHVKFKYVLHVRGQAGEQCIKAPVTGKVANRQTPDSGACEYLFPWCWNYLQNGERNEYSFTLKIIPFRIYCCCCKSWFWDVYCVEQSIKNMWWHDLICGHKINNQECDDTVPFLQTKIQIIKNM